MQQEPSNPWTLMSKHVQNYETVLRFLRRYNGRFYSRGVHPRTGAVRYDEVTSKALESTILWGEEELGHQGQHMFDLLLDARLCVLELMRWERFDRWLLEHAWLTKRLDVGVIIANVSKHTPEFSSLLKQFRQWDQDQVYVKRANDVYNTVGEQALPTDHALYNCLESTIDEEDFDGPFTKELDCVNIGSDLRYQDVLRRIGDSWPNRQFVKERGVHWLKLIVPDSPGARSFARWRVITNSDFLHLLWPNDWGKTSTELQLVISLLTVHDAFEDALEKKSVEQLDRVLRRRQVQLTSCVTEA